MRHSCTAEECAVEVGNRTLSRTCSSAGRGRRRQPAHPCRSGGARRVRHCDRMRVWPATSGLGEAAVAAPRRDRRFELKLLRLAAAVPAVLAFAVLASRPNFRLATKRSGRTRPASPRLPPQAANSFNDRLETRPPSPTQFNPSLPLNVVTSDSPPSLWRCSRTPRPRAISGT